MPNWCANELYIASKNKHTLDAFTKKVGLKDDKPDFDFGKILPEPDYEKVEVLPPFPDIVGDKKPVDSEQAWWDWRVQNWGTKWDLDGLDIPPSFGKWKQFGDDNKDIHFVHFEFMSAWSPPEAVIIAAGNQNPSLMFALQYYEPGCDFEGELIMLNGEIETHNTRECKPEIESLAEWKAGKIGERK